jgi:hypothetical protein
MPNKAVRRREVSADKRASLRRVAVQLASMLPEDEDEALHVLFYARRIVLRFMHDDAVPPSAFMTDGGLTVVGPQHTAR